jgi:hypothetical protein
MTILTPAAPTPSLFSTSALTPAFTLHGTGDFIDLGDPPAGSGFRAITESRTLPSGQGVSMDLWQADRRAGESWIDAYNRFTVDYTVATANQTGVAPFMSFEDFVASNVYAQELKVSVDTILAHPDARIPDRVTSMVVNLPAYSIPEANVFLCDTVGKRISYGWGELTKDWPSELHAAGERFLDALPYALGVIGAAFLIGGLVGATAAVMGYLTAAGLGVLALQAGAIVGFLLDIAFGCVNKSDVDRSVALIKPTFYNTVVGATAAATGYGLVRIIGAIGEASSGLVPAANGVEQSGGPITYIQNAAGRWVPAATPAGTPAAVEELVLGADGVYGPASAPAATPSTLPAPTQSALPSGVVRPPAPGLPQGHIPLALPGYASTGNVIAPGANDRLSQILQRLPQDTQLETSVPLIGPARGHIANVRYDRDAIMASGLPSTMTWKQFTDMIAQLLSFGRYTVQIARDADGVTIVPPEPNVAIDLDSGLSGPHLLPDYYHISGVAPATGLSTPIGLDVHVINDANTPVTENTLDITHLSVNSESPITWGGNNANYPDYLQEQPSAAVPRDDAPYLAGTNSDPDAVSGMHRDIAFETATDPANPEALGGGAVPVNRGALRMDMTTSGQGEVSIEASADVMNGSTLPPARGAAAIRRVISEGVILALNSAEDLDMPAVRALSAVVSTPDGYYMLRMTYDPLFRMMQINDITFERNDQSPPQGNHESESVRH